MKEKNKAAVELGRLGGRAKSDAKTRAARENARKPRKKNTLSGGLNEAVGCGKVKEN